MIRSLRVQIVIALCDAIVIGYIIDRITGFPLWGIGAFAVLALASIILIPMRDPIPKMLNIDLDIYALFKTISLVIIFFIGCIILAGLIIR